MQTVSVKRVARILCDERRFSQASTFALIPELLDTPLPSQAMSGLRLVCISENGEEEAAVVGFDAKSTVQALLEEASKRRAISCTVSCLSTNA